MKRISLKLKIFKCISSTILIFILFPSLVSAKNFPHISTFGVDFWNLTGDLDQAKWLAQRQDWVIGPGGETIYDAMKSANPDVKFMPYIAYNTYEPSIQSWIQNWIQQTSYNFEDTFYHYYYDTTVKLRGTNPSTVLIKGYGGGTATTIEESRVPSSWAQNTNGGFDTTTGRVIRLNINPTSIAWRRGYEAYILKNRMEENASKGKYADGIFLDTFEGTVYTPNDLQLERTIEMRNLSKFTRTEANAQAIKDLIDSLHQLEAYLTNQIGRPIIAVPNVGDVDSLYGDYANLVYKDRSQYDYLFIETMIAPGHSTYRIPRLRQVYDSMTNEGKIFFATNATKILDVSERIIQFEIVAHYLINHPNYILMYHRGNPNSWGGYPGGQLYTTHWHPNLEYNIGVPVVRSGPDNWGISNTDRFFTFVSVTNNSDGLKNYTILGREYTNALVLAKFGATGFVANAGNNPTTHNLGGNYQLLQPDNSLGPIITSITLGDSEGAILIKSGGTPDTTPPAAPTGLAVS